MGYTLENMGKRMITSNLLRNKRKLVDEAEKLEADGPKINERGF